MISYAQGDSLRAQITPAFCGDLLEAIDLGVLLIDGEDAVVGLNGVAQALLDVADLAYTRFWPDYFPDLNVRASRIGAIARGEPIGPVETVLHNHAGLRIPVSMQTMRSREQSEFEGAVIIRDLRPGRTAHRRIMQRERLATIGETITIIAHESRNALQRIQACLTLIDRRGDDEIRELVADMQGAQDQLRSLYEELRSFAQPLQIVRERVDVERLLRNVWHDLEISWRQKHIELDIERSHTVEPVVLADKEKLGQVLRNLLQNAVDASSHQDRIRVQLSNDLLENEPALQLDVQDQGPGIAAADRNRIFDLMFTTKEDGTGVGLALVQQIVVAHGGVVEVEPESWESDGARITVTLPRF